MELRTGKGVNQLFTAELDLCAMGGLDDSLQLQIDDRPAYQALSTRLVNS